MEQGGAGPPPQRVSQPVGNETSDSGSKPWGSENSSRKIRARATASTLKNFSPLNRATEGQCQTQILAIRTAFLEDYKFKIQESQGPLKQRSKVVAFPSFDLKMVLFTNRKPLISQEFLDGPWHFSSSKSQLI